MVGPNPLFFVCTLHSSLMWWKETMQLPKSRKSAPAALAVAASKPEDKCERTRLHQTGSQRKSPDAPDFTDCAPDF